jgi:23S rRNA pseudouridine1911/1915/1917 synthase
MKKRVLTRAFGDPEPLDALLTIRCDVDADAARRWIGSGAVYVGTERVTESRRVPVGAKITVYLGGAQSTPPPLDVVHVDDWIAVVNKPAGMPSQAERSQRSGALDVLVQQAVGGAARLMHRLDKEASGLVLFALRERASASLQSALESGAIERRYLAIVDSELRGDGVIRHRIGRHARDRRLRAALPEHAPAGDAACTHYRSVGHAKWRGRPITAVELELETGRTHQLRVHLSAIGHAIVGDAAYGGPPFERLCLHAHALELPHPRDGRQLRLAAPLPEPLLQLVPGLTSPLT